MYNFRKMIIKVVEYKCILKLLTFAQLCSSLALLSPTEFDIPINAILQAGSDAQLSIELNAEFSFIFFLPTKSFSKKSISSITKMILIFFLFFVLFNAFSIAF